MQVLGIQHLQISCEAVNQAVLERFTTNPTGRAIHELPPPGGLSW